MELIVWLEQWFQAQCDGDWEHSNGVSIATLDNPGWMVNVDLLGTGVERASLDDILIQVGEVPSGDNGNIGGSEWMKCEISKGRFCGAGDPKKLNAILNQLRDWIITNTNE